MGNRGEVRGADEHLFTISKFLAAKLWLELHTVVVVFEQQRPVAGVDCRRTRRWLDCVVVVDFYEGHDRSGMKDLDGGCAAVAIPVVRSFPTRKSKLSFSP
jgi:hypothetical protein